MPICDVQAAIGGIGSSAAKVLITLRVRVCLDIVFALGEFCEPVCFD